MAFELKREWTGVLISVLFALYFTTIYSGVSYAPDVGRAATRLLSGMRDWIYLFGLPLLGNLMNRTIFGYWKDDPFTRRIAHWRTMPIPLRAIATARQAQSVLMIAVSGSLFIAVPCLLNPSWMTGGDANWISAGIVWIAYGMIVQTGYIYLELGFSGKTFVIWYLGYCVILAGVSVVLAWQNVSLFRESFKLADAQPYLVPAAAVAIALAAMRFGLGRTVERMRNRSYTF